jgi:hypothetical protein
MPQTQIMAAVVEAALVVWVEIWLRPAAQVEQAGLEHRHQLRVQRLQEHGVGLAAALIAWELPLPEAKETETAQVQVPILAAAAMGQQKQGLGLLAAQAALVSLSLRFQIIILLLSQAV